VDWKVGDMVAVRPSNNKNGLFWICKIEQIFEATPKSILSYFVRWFELSDEHDDDVYYESIGTDKIKAESVISCKRFQMIRVGRKNYPVLWQLPANFKENYLQ